MADKYVNQTDLAYYHNRIKTLFPAKTDFDTLSDEFDTLSDTVDGLVTEGGEPNVIETVKVNGTALTPDAQKAVDVNAAQLTIDGDFNAYVEQGDQSLSFMHLPSDPYTLVAQIVRDGDPSQIILASTLYVDENGGKIDKIKVNGIEQAITNKEVDLTINDMLDTATPTYIEIESVRGGNTINFVGTIPTTTSALTNDAGFQTAAEVQSAINTAVASAYVYKGSVATVDDLPSTADTGDVYDVQATGMNYAWNGTAWDALGQYVDTSVFWTTTDLVAMTTAEIDAIIDGE